MSIKVHTKSLPYMEPHIFDKFVDFVSASVDMESFKRSDLNFKLTLYRRFLKTLTLEDKQYSISFEI